MHATTTKFRRALALVILFAAGLAQAAGVNYADPRNTGLLPYTKLGSMTGSQFLGLITDPVGTGAYILRVPGSIPSCSNVTSSKLLYDNTTGAFSCGTDQSSGGSFTVTRQTFSNANATATTTGSLDVIAQVGTMSLPRTLTLNAASAYAAGSRVLIQDESCTVSPTNTITVDANASETINGSLTATINRACGSMVLETDGTKWVIVSKSFYAGSEITNTPAGGIAATDAQAALNELDTEKAPKDSPVLTTKLGYPYGTAFPGSPATGDTIIITDDSAAGACDSAAGSAATLCRWNGSAWVAVGGSGGGGSGTVNAGTLGQYAYYGANGNVIGGRDLSSLATDLLGVAPTVVVDSTTARTLTAADNGKILRFTNAGAVTVTVGTGFSGYGAMICRGGTGTVSLSASSTTLNTSSLVLNGQYTCLSILPTGTANVFDVIGATGVVDVAPEAVASAATTSIFSTASRNVSVTGTTGITSLGNCTAGDWRRVTFAGILTITHSATNPFLPNAGGNITTAANDTALAVCVATNNVTLVSYQRANGQALQTGAGGGTVTNTGSLTANAPMLGNGGSDSKVSASINSDGAGQIQLGASGSVVGSIRFFNITGGGGYIQLSPVTGTLSSVTLSLPNATDTLMGKQTTDTMLNKTYDCAGTGNVCRQKGYIYLTHPHFCDGTNAQIGTTATSVSYGHATFVNSVDQASNYCEYLIQVPEDIDTSVALRARLKVLLGGADTGSQRYVLSSVSVADSAVPTSATLANAVNVDFAGDASGASGDVETSAWTTLTSWNGALTAGQTWRIRLARDGDTSDTSTVNSTELGVVLEYGVTQ